MCLVKKLLRFYGLLALANAFAPSSHHHNARSSLHQQSFLLRASSANKSAVLPTKKCEIAVFGGGFGGLYTALAISREARRRNKQLDVVLVEPTDSFVFLPLLYDLTAGTATEAEVCPFYRDLLRNTGVRHIQGSLESLSSDGTAVVRTKQDPECFSLTFNAGVVAVGASPNSILERVPGALEYAQPFYTAQDAKDTRGLLKRLEEDHDEERPRIAIVGGGFGGVELAASVKRRFKTASVTLISKGAPLAGTRAEHLVDKALEKLGVKVEDAAVSAIERRSDGGAKCLVVERKGSNSGEPMVNDDEWDAVLWTAGSGPAGPVPAGCSGLEISESGRLAIDPTLRCMYEDNSRSKPPCLWALGDCAEILMLSDDEPATPKTAQAAMQQAEVVASNVMSQLESNGKVAASAKTFAYQDLGSMLTLGGPNGAMMAPRDGAALAPILGPILDSVDQAFGTADRVVSSTIGRSPVVERLGLSADVLGLSLGSHGIGADTDGGSTGTFAGTLTGAARRAVYAVLMPTNQQRAVSFVSAAVSTAAALAKEASDRNKK